MTPYDPTQSSDYQIRRAARRAADEVWAKIKTCGEAWECRVEVVDAMLQQARIRTLAAGELKVWRYGDEFRLARNGSLQGTYPPSEILAEILRYARR